MSGWRGWRQAVSGESIRSGAGPHNQQTDNTSENNTVTKLKAKVLTEFYHSCKKMDKLKGTVIVSNV